MRPNACAPFDGERYEEVAESTGVSAARLRELASALQTVAESVRSVDELVFEYRKAYGDVVAERTGSAYCLRVPPHVWTEFGDRLDATDAERSALESLHAAWSEDQRTSGGTADTGEKKPLVLRRS